MIVIRRSSTIPNRIGNHAGIQSRLSLPMRTIAVQQKQQLGAFHPSGPESDRNKKLANLISSNLSDAVVRDGLQTLFHSEYILMAEYIELMIPLLYSFYLTVLFHLPVAVYYPNTASMTVHELRVGVASILAYAAIEVVSFTSFVAELRLLASVPVGICTGNAGSSATRVPLHVDHYNFASDTSTLWYVYWRSEVLAWCEF